MSVQGAEEVGVLQKNDGGRFARNFIHVGSAKLPSHIVTDSVNI